MQPLLRKWLVKIRTDNRNYLAGRSSNVVGNSGAVTS